jgi:hypothetical protein
LLSRKLEGRDGKGSAVNGPIQKRSMMAFKIHGGVLLDV